MSTSSPEVTTSESVGPVASAVAKASGKASGGIRDGLAHAREQLGDTVEALADKAAVPAVVTDTCNATKDMAQAKIEQVTEHLQDSKDTVQDKADELRRQAKSSINQAWAQVPGPVMGRVNHMAQAVRQRPAPAAALVFAVLVLLVLRRLFRTGE